MLKWLTNIKDVSRIEQGLVASLPSFQKLSFESTEDPNRKGAFGAVYPVKGVDGRTRLEDDLVVKIIPVREDNAEKANHAYEVIKLLHVKANRHQQRTGETLFATVPGLAGLPFIVLRAYDEVMEVDCIVMIMVNLEFLGYKDCGRDANVIELTSGINVIQRLQLAMQLSQAMKWLHAQSFIHSDLGVSAVFINESTVRLAIIDFDSGYHFDNQPQPLTEGKIAWGLPALWHRLLNKLGVDRELRVVDRLQKEYFTLAVSVFELIFGLTPYFYLHPDPDGKERYLKRCHWPEADFDDEHTRIDTKPEHQRFFQRYQYYGEGGLRSVLDALASVFTFGYTDGYRRYSPTQWIRTIGEVLPTQALQPHIVTFEATRYEVSSKTEELLLTWEANHAYAVYLNGELQVGQTGSLFVTPGGDRTYQLRVVNEFGEHTEDLVITAVREEPVFMHLAISDTLRTSLEPLTLSWECAHTERVEIIGIDSQQPAFGSLTVEPIAATTYEIIAHGYFDQKVIETIEIDVIKPVVDSFYFEVNLEHGLDNVDLHFTTRHANHVTILPKPGAVETTKGVTHIKLHADTEFKLTAHGDFAEATKTLVARPFPIPAIVQLRMPQPEMNVNLTLRPDALPALTLEKLKQPIGVANLQIDYVPLNTAALSRSLEPPPFVQLPPISSPKQMSGHDFEDIFHHIKSQTSKQITDEKTTDRPV